VSASDICPMRTVPMVFVVDDDDLVREWLELLIQSAGCLAETFASAEEFLARPRVLTPSCLVLDVALPNLNGLDLQQRIAADRVDMPIIFITGDADVPTTVRAMKAGAAEFLTKPFDADVLLNAIRVRIASRSEDAVAPRPLRLTHRSRARGLGFGGYRRVE
jgi:FixJ family two-component response regulator